MDEVLYPGLALSGQTVGGGRGLLQTRSANTASELGQALIHVLGSKPLYNTFLLTFFLNNFRI